MAIRPGHRQCAVVLNDLRAVPVAAAVCELNRLQELGESARLVLSERILSGSSIDYGEYLPGWYKTLKVFTLRMLYGVKVIPAQQKGLSDKRSSTGVMSSLMSITHDSNASPKKYQALWQALEDRAVGAEEIAKFLLSHNYTSVAVFNGRTASSSPIVRACHDRGVNCIYYEYSAQGEGMGYISYPYPIHASHLVGRDLEAFCRWALKTVPALELAGQKERAARLKNEFTKYFSVNPQHRFRTVVFLGSDHEYTNLMEDIVGLRYTGNVGLVERAIARYAHLGPLAVRAHPNQMRDPSAAQTLAEIAQLCQKHDVQFYSPESGVSSHSLIQSADMIVTEYSSVAFDAIYLGKKVDVIGDRELITILTMAPSHVVSDPASVAKYVSERMVLMPSLFFVPFGKIYGTLARLFAGVERRVLSRLRIVLNYRYEPENRKELL